MFSLRETAFSHPALYKSLALNTAPWSSFLFARWEAVPFVSHDYSLLSSNLRSGLLVLYFGFVWVFGFFLLYLL